MPLNYAEIGETKTIQRVGGNEKTKKFLEELGFVAGATVSVVTSMAGNIIVNMKESRVAISKEMAARIYV
ncbi:MAG: ferrous iron transport protein A [Lachnospiraceae bacterium]|nr:ferrous iron transport protein A [Lachnospiraceae bacterium]